MLSFIRRHFNIKIIIIIILIFCFLKNQILNNNFQINNFLMSSKIQEIIAQIEDSNYTSIKQPNDIEQQETLQNTEKTNNMKKIKEDEKINNEPQKNSQDFVWQIQIPAINLNALIAEGTSKEVMDEFVGHFEETVKRNGNIGLAAHNRGYKVNYFQNLKKLKEGDEIIYKYKEFEKRYVVKTLKIISDEDWSLLENTEDNRITLITCVENEPQYRRAVQAIEV